ncbi:MAG: E3 binding domain-containing protein [Anaerolineales bacterium]|nr:E3 binding domain-containing protein [Anaerolineales bacterium]
MACCGKSDGVVNSTPSDQFISLSYLGSNTAPILFEGYLKRRYRVRSGSVIKVHPDDVSRLKNTGRFREVSLVVNEVEPEPEPTIAEPVAIDATDTAVSLAAEHGIDLSTVQGTGAGGRIVTRDVKALID